MKTGTRIIYSAEMKENIIFFCLDTALRKTLYGSMWGKVGMEGFKGVQKDRKGL